MGWKALGRGGLALVAAAMLASATPVLAASKPPAKGAEGHPKLDGTLNKRAKAGKGTSRVIVVLKSELPGSEVTKLGGRLGRRLGLISGQVVELSDHQITKLADHPAVLAIHHDRPFRGTMARAAVSTGARSAQFMYGLSGAGIGVAVVDSGITPWHDDLSDSSGSQLVQSPGGQRVAAFVDFVNGQSTPYDDFGHGTHVSGIIAGNGYDSWGIRAGMAPSSHIVSLKVLDGQGNGVISNVIAALEFAIANRQQYNIRVINLSVGAPVTGSYYTDPLTLAAKRAVDAGIVVVAAAGNRGKNALGQPVYGGITAPANAPWVLTVGASSHQGTLRRDDDVMAGFSSRGPTPHDFAAKPDVVAPGTGIVSLSAPASLMYSTKALFLLPGSVTTSFQPYLSLSGTSMAAPAVSGAVALMLEANPNLTPNLVKAILQYTAEERAGYNALTQGAGFLNTRAAVDLARYFAGANQAQPYPSDPLSSQQIIWGNRRVSGGGLLPNANAWNLTTVWGSMSEEDGDAIVWGTRCDTDGDPDCDNIVWGTNCEGSPDCDNIVWGTSVAAGPNIVWGTNVVWGTECQGDDCDNIVWGTNCDGNPDCDNIVWGTADECTGPDCDNIVWGTADDDDNIVWGTNCEGNPDCDNIVWGTADDDDNIVWGTSTAADPGDPNPLPDEAYTYVWYVLVYAWEWQTYYSSWFDGATTDDGTTNSADSTASSATTTTDGTASSATTTTDSVTNGTTTTTTTATTTVSGTTTAIGSTTSGGGF